MKLKLNMNGNGRKYKANLWKIGLFKFLVSLHFISAVLVPFFTQFGRISFTQIMILQSIFSLGVFLLEIPTGAIADHFGRKISLLIGCLFGAIGAVVYASFANFYIFALGELLFAVSCALFSGADDALVYDTLKRTKQTRKSKKVLGRLESFSLLGILVAAPIGSIIAASLGVRAPMYFFVIPQIFAFLVALTLKEPKTNKKIESIRYLLTLKNGVKYFYKNKVLKILALDMIVVAVISYFLIWLYQPLLMQSNVNIVYFGLIHAAITLSEILFMSNYSRLEKICGSKKGLIFFSTLLTGGSFIVAGLTKNLFLIILSILVAAIGLGREPLFSSYMNKYIPSSKRATVLSSINMLRRLVLVVLNPLVGFLVDKSLNYTLVGLGVIAVVFAFFSGVRESHLKD